MPDTSSPTTFSHRSLLDRFRMDAFLLRVDWHLEGSLPGSDRKAIIESLRQELATEPRELSQALDGLGSPRSLARRYADEGVRRPLWSLGVVIGGLALSIYWAVFLTYTAGMLAAVDSFAPATAHSHFLSIQVRAFSSADGFGIGWTGGWAWLVVPLIIVAVGFLAGARLWRALPALRHEGTSRPSDDF
ncbi:MAG TPA: hypothetical protein VNJ54_08610 [Plantibacter sp.]|uniref:hypothetical protein n=1 Tax=unclassified Plantibacter TaxID=2624265 RepID=UPI002D12EAEA|nr:hypothetical protein [Plantibacter sp.]